MIKTRSFSICSQTSFGCFKLNGAVNHDKINPNYLVFKDTKGVDLIMSRISTNTSLFIQRQLTMNQTSYAQTLERLSSGLTINRASDNAAGLSISQKMRAQIRGLDQATRNIQDGVSLIQVADGAMNEIQVMLTRGYELSIQAMNDLYETTDRKTIQQELEQLVKELDTIYWTTNFNELPLLQGSEVKTVIKTEYLPTKVEIEETIFETKGQLPNWISSGNSSSWGYLNNNLITFNETFYEMSNDKIIRSDGVEVTSFKTATGTTYTQGSTRIDTSAPGPSSTMTFKGDDGFDYTIHRTHTPFTKEQQHAGAYLDFSGLDQGADWRSLVDTGFQTTCCSCPKRYSIKFTDGATGVVKSGDHLIYSVDISGVSSSNELISRVLSVLSANGSTETRTDSNGIDWEVSVPENHLTGFAAEKDATGQTTGRLLIYDFPASTINRKPNPAKEQGIFESGYYESTVIKTEKEVLTAVNTPVQINGKDLILQVGESEGEQLIVKLPDLHLDTLKLKDTVDVVSDEHSRLLTQQSFLQAKQVVSAERSRLGATQNRLESLHTRTSIETENVTHADSRIRDTDYAQALVSKVKQELLTQSAQHVLSQVNLTAQQVLNLLKQ